MNKNLIPKSGNPTIIPVNKILLLGEQQEIDLSNNEFLEAIFVDAVGDQRPLCCSFFGHAGKVSSVKWAAIPWLKEKSTLPSRGNNYFSLASFKPCSEKKYRRQKRYFAAQHAVMLDDVGTKAVGLDRLTLTPSWLLETSPGNFQAGYIFREPIIDGAIVERLMKSIIFAGLCDPGADGRARRLVHLGHDLAGLTHLVELGRRASHASPRAWITASIARVTSSGLWSPSTCSSRPRAS